MPEVPGSANSLAPVTAADGAKGETTQEPTKTESFPTYYVSDGSAIDISIVSHEFEESMAKNSFSSNSYQASA